MYFKNYRKATTHVSLNRMAVKAVIIFVLSISLSCQQDDIDGDMTRDYVPQEELLNDSLRGSGGTVGSKAMSNNKVLKTVFSEFSGKKHAKGVELETNQFSFTIDNSVANYYTINDRQYYSFLVTSHPDQGNNHLENLIVSLKDNGSYETYLLDYGLSEEEFKTFTQEELNNSQPKFTRLNISSNDLENSALTSRSRYLFCINNYRWKEVVCGCSEKETEYKLVLVSRDCELVAAQGSAGEPYGNSGSGGSTDNPNVPGYGNDQGSAPPSTGGPGGSNDEEGDPMVILPMESQVVLRHKLQQSDQDLPENLMDLLNALDPDLLDEMVDLYNSATDYPGLDQFVMDVLDFNNENEGDEGTSDFIDEAIDAFADGGNVDFENKVIIDSSFEDNDCLSGVYEAMGEAPTFNNYLQDFDGVMSVADLKFGAKNNFGTVYEDYTNAMAITNPPLASNLILIDFNTDPSTTGNILNQPDVFKAVSLMHEILHATMYRKMLDAVKAAEINQTNLNWRDWPNNTDFDDFVEALENKYFGIFTYYTKYNWNTSTPNNAQHQQMAQWYRDVIKQALTDYDPTLTEAQKEALSWIGLNSADIVAWQLKTPEEQEAINNTIQNIQNTFPNGCN